MAVKRLMMTFANDSGTKVSISLNDPREDLTANEVETAMDGIITANIFTTAGGNLVSKDSAKIIETETTVLYEGE